MNTLQISTILNADPITKLILQDVCPIDRIPFPKSDPAAYVINLDESYKPGSHWVAVYLDRKHKQANYFDPVGMPPHPACAPLLETCPIVRYNRIVLQDRTMVCGQFVTMFLLLRARGYSFDETIDRLNHPQNDLIMHKMFKPIFPHLPFYPSGFLR